MSDRNSPLNSPDGSNGHANGTTSKITRTVAIIKTHALIHRFEIERRIQEAGFEIIKERQMEFDTETDPEYLEELFGEDVASLAEGPVWVYVLERRRAVEVWLSLMGDWDPAVAKDQSPNSLRGLYGISPEQNAVMGAPDVETAESQIASLFASSPPFPTTDLPDEDGGASRFSTLRSVTSSVLNELKRVTSSDATSNITSGGGSGGRLTSTGSNSNSKNGNSFKARTLPTTHIAPTIAPRLTKAASLRLNGPILKDGRYVKNAPRQSLSQAQIAQTFANVPGHRRAETISVASTAAPVIAPRLTKAAALRLGITPPTASPGKKPVQPVVKKEVKTETKTTFEGVPGHKRRETISVASVSAPSVAPRLNKSAALRVAKEKAPPTSFMFRTPSSSSAPSLSRSSSVSSLTSRTSRPPSQASMVAAPRPPSRQPSVPRSHSTTPSQNPANGTLTPSTNGVNGVRPKLPRPSSIGMPTIAPRTNKSAALRAQKKAEEEAAAAAVASKQRRMSSRRSTVM